MKMAVSGMLRRIVSKKLTDVFGGAYRFHHQGDDHFTLSTIVHGATSQKHLLEAACLSKTVVPPCKSTRHYNPKINTDRIFMCLIATKYY
jgi:hypothetical protein